MLDTGSTMVYLKIIFMTVVVFGMGLLVILQIIIGIIAVITLTNSFI